MTIYHISKPHPHAVDDCPILCGASYKGAPGSWRGACIAIEHYIPAILGRSTPCWMCFKRIPAACEVCVMLAATYIDTERARQASL